MSRAERRPELGVPAKLVGFAVILAVVFGAALLTGGRFAQSVPASAPTPPPASAPMEGHDTAETPGTDDHADQPGDDTHAEHASGTPPYTLDGYSLVLADPTLDRGRGALTLRLLGPDGQPVPDYTVVQEKLLHLIIVREDLGGFHHLHPRRTADGAWTVQVDLGTGRWRAYADFQPSALGREITLSTPLTVRGTYRPVPVPAPAGTDTVDGYTVTATAEPVAGQTTPITITINRAGRPVTDLEPYLGAPAHIVIIRYHDMAYLHVHGHADTSGPTIETAATFDTNGTYRMFVQFSHAGELHRAEFTWEVA